MRGIVGVLAAAMLICSFATNGESAASPRASIEDARWISGIWRSEADDDGTGSAVFIETWFPPQAGAMLGSGGTLGTDGNLGFWEGLNIVESDGSLIYVPFPAGKAAEVHFPLAERSAERLEFRNLEHDFPQRITYQRQGPDRLVIEAHGSGRSLRWNMLRQCTFIDSEHGPRCDKGITSQ